MSEQQENVRKLAKLIKGIDFAMLTTAEGDGTLRSRPMATQQTEFDGDLRFFTGADSPKVGEIDQDRQVNVSYADPDKQQSVSVSGKARLVRDRQKMEDLWSPVYKARFPQGLDDPNLALLQIEATEAQYWTAPSGAVTQALSFAKALVTGERADMGKNEKLVL